MNTMNNQPSTPFHSIGQSSEAQGAEYTQVPNSLENFADDDGVKQWILTNVVPLMSYVRDDGIEARKEWSEIRRMRMLEHDDNQTYKGMSNAYLPSYARSHETRVGHISQALFPTDDYIDVRATDPSLANQAAVLKAWMQYQFEKQMRLRSNIKPFLRQLYDYGTSVGKIWYDKAAQTKTGRTVRSVIPTMQSTLMDFGNSEDAMRQGARFKTRNMHSWYMWPPTVNDLKEATLVFEDIQMSKQYIEETGKREGWKNLDLAIWSPQPGNVNSDLQDQQQAIRLSPSTAVDNTRMGETAHWAYLQEAYFNMPIPDRLYRENEERGSSVPVHALMAGTIPVLVRRNPYWFQHAPYVVKKLNESVDSFYGVGMGRLGKNMQYLINDFVNQTNDNGIYGLNPVILTNPGMLVGPMEPLEPGRLWNVTDVNAAVKFDRPPMDQIQWALQILNMLKTDMNDLLSTPPILQGNNAKGGGRTATGAQLLQTNVKTEMQDQVEDIELEVLIPLMEMVHKLGQQYQDKEISIATAGGIVTVRPDDLVGQFGFQWLASSQASNQQQRAQQAMTLLQMLQAYIPYFQQIGYKYDPVPLIKRIAKDGMGFRDFDGVLTQMPQPPMGMPGQPQPGQGTPPQSGQLPGQAPGDVPRSAVEQAAGGSAGMAPGEGGAFSEVRSQADDLAAMMGGSNGQ